MESLKREIEKINDDNLSPTNKLKKKQLYKIADICSKIRIADSQNLLEIFDTFKNPTIKFN